jgi:hypothetical protein
MPSARGVIAGASIAVFIISRDLQNIGITTKGGERKIVRKKGSLRWNLGLPPRIWPVARIRPSRHSLPARLVLISYDLQLRLVIVCGQDHRHKEQVHIPADEHAVGISAIRERTALSQSSCAISMRLEAAICTILGFGPACGFRTVGAACAWLADPFSFPDDKFFFPFSEMQAQIQRGSTARGGGQD